MILVRLKARVPEVLQFGGPPDGSMSPFFVIEKDYLKIRGHLKEPVEALDPKTGKMAKTSAVEIAEIPMDQVEMVVAQPDPPQQVPKSSGLVVVPGMPK